MNGSLEWRLTGSYREATIGDFDGGVLVHVSGLWIRELDQ